MKILNKCALFTLLVSLLFGGCTSSEKVNIERPRDAWVMRTVLDKKPRMLSIALNKKLWVAYNTQTAGMYKAWNGIVSYEGSVFNGDHGFQPTTQGIPLVQESDENPWRLIMKEQTVVPEVIYRGHAFRNDQVILKYDLKYDQQIVRIEEKPEFISTSTAGMVGFERIFTVIASNSDAQVGLMTQVSAIASEEDYQTDGKFTVVKKGNKEVNGKQYVDIQGMLVLNKKGNTNLSVHFSFEESNPHANQSLEQAGEENIVSSIMAKSDCALCHNQDVSTVGPAYIDIANRYPNEPGYVNRLAKKVITGGAGNWGNAIMTPHADMSHEDASILVAYILSLRKDTPDKPQLARITNKPVVEKVVVPGDGSSLESIHPSFDVAQARPESFQPKVGGMDFLADGRMVVSTWDSVGSVFILDGLQGDDPEAIQVKRIAMGLAEPLGLKVVDDEIYIMQKQELTRLVDLNNDDIIDEYQTVCNGWKVSDNFHEFAFGLVYKDGYFYGTLATAINNGGASTYPQIPDRGKVIKIAKKDGSFSLIASGLRTPNGIGLGVDNEIFIADNQGDWLPASKLVHLQEGAWYGSRSVDFEGTKNRVETPPLIWLQQDEIGNSPSQPTVLNVGPYQNQMVYGDVTHGGLKRVFVEKINNTYQGVVFRFTQGLEGGVNRLSWGPDGALYIGQVGLNGNWGQNGKFMYGLQKLKYNDKSTFEMLAVRVQPKGLEIEFTEPLKEGIGHQVADYAIRQWTYTPTANYGGPKVNEEQLRINDIQISSDRKKAVINVSGMKEKHVVYIKLNRQTMVNQKDVALWSTEAWYTLNSIPTTNDILAALP